MADISVTSGYDGLNLPYSPEAEQSVLGAVLLDSSCLDRIAEILPRAEYFHLANHRMIYDAMLEKPIFCSWLRSCLRFPMWKPTRASSGINTTSAL